MAGQRACWVDSSSVFNRAAIGRLLCVEVNCRGVCVCVCVCVCVFVSHRAATTGQNQQVFRTGNALETLRKPSGVKKR